VGCRRGWVVEEGVGGVQEGVGGVQEGVGGAGGGGWWRRQRVVGEVEEGVDTRSVYGMGEQGAGKA
jgi:hypothetical protein